MAANQPSIQLSPHALPFLTPRALSLVKIATPLHMELDRAGAVRLLSSAGVNERANRMVRFLVRDLFQAVERDYTINHRKSLSNLRIRWYKRLDQAFGNLLVTDVTIEEINAYIAERLRAKAANGTINRDLATLRRCWMLAIETGRLKFGERPYFPMLAEKNVRKGFVKDSQYAQLATATARIGVWLRALFEVGFTYGWRKEELLSRRVRHADFMERTLNLDPGETKNDEARSVHMTPRVWELLKHCAAGKGPEDYLFTRAKDRLGRKTRTAYIVDFRKDWEEATRAAGCSGLLFHDLRRTSVSNMIRDGVSERQAQTVSGHKTRAVFDRYHIVDPRQQQEIAVKIETGATLRGILADPLETPSSQLQLPFGDDLPKSADQELAVCAARGCGESLSPSNKSGLCRAHTIVASRKKMSAKARKCEHQGQGCLGEFNPTCPTQKYCPVCRRAAKRALARAAEHPPRKPAVSDDPRRNIKKKALPAADDPIPA